jgi:hypothetical protein
MKPRFCTWILIAIAATGSALAPAQTSANQTDTPQSSQGKSPPKKSSSAAPIYGSQMMTPEERTAYRDKIRNAKTAKEREEIRDEHHKEMQARAKERGVTLPDKPQGARQGRPNSANRSNPAS